VANLLIIEDLAGTNEVKLTLNSDTNISQSATTSFQIPLETTDRDEIHWYFSQYLSEASDNSSQRAEAIEAGLRNLGRLLFEKLLQAETNGTSLYKLATDEGLENCRAIIRSDRPEFLSIPWELINEPEQGYLISKMPSIVRQPINHVVIPSPTDLPNDQLNVLMIAPRPQLGDYSLSGGLTAETAQSLEALPVQAELEYLYPPTYENLKSTLTSKANYYHVLHIDGSIVSSDNDSIAFEQVDGSQDLVDIQELAKCVNTAGIPTIIANYGPVSRENPWPGPPAVSLKLSAAGISNIISLPYPIQSPSGEKFLRKFYTSLSEGLEVSRCVAESRGLLMNDPNRITSNGKHIFWDWITPTIYESNLYQSIAITIDEPDPLGPPVLQPQQAIEQDLQLPAAGQYGLIGRQLEACRMERLIDQNKIILLAGNTGRGKTEFALNLGRWFQKVGRPQRPGGVFYTTFETSHPSGLERVIHEIGTSIADLAFADMTITQQRDWVTEYFQRTPSLLIWDNVENISGFPAGSPGLLEEHESAELNEFLSQITSSGATSVLLISRRSHESWLNIEHVTEPWNGLNTAESVELAGHIIEKSSVDPNRITPAVSELVQAVSGHPLALQIALPLLKDVPLSVLIAELKRTEEELPPSSDEEGRDKYFTAVMEYAWTKMSHRNRTHLPFLSLFQRRVMMDILNHMTQEQAYKSAMGEQLGWGACRTLLRTAQSSGFLDPVSPSVYQIHPSLPWFYGKKLSLQLQGHNIRNMEQEFVRVYADTADYFMESLYENQDSGVTAILAEEGNLTQALGLALESEQWDNAQLLVQPLAQVYHMQKRFAELRRLRGQILDIVGQTSEEAIAKNAVELWLYLLGTEASEAVDLHDLEYADNLNNELLQYLESQPEGDSDPRTAAVYHQFGQVARQRWQLGEAVEWFEKSLAIVQDSEDPSAASDDFFALAQVKQNQRYYTEAKELYQKALDIHQRLPDEESMVNDYRALGTVCQLKFEYEEAANWLNRARAIVEEQRDEETAILIFHQMGTVAHAQYFFDDAISWYQQALQLSDRLGNQHQMAVEFHHLGLLHQTRGIVYEEAEEWYLTALDQWNKIGDRRSAGDECRQIGVLFHEQEKYEEADKWYREASGIFEEIADVPRLARTYGQLSMIAESQDNITDALEWATRTYDLAVNHNLSVIIQVKSHLSRLRDTYGHENFNSWWLDFTGTEAPEDLDVDTSKII